MKKVLIIEDDPKTALALAVRLKAEGYATWIAGDVIQGAKLARKHQPDLIFLDVSLPGGNGFDLAERFQRCPETHDIPIVFLTASTDPLLREKVLRLGAAGLLEKPYDAVELLTMAKWALDRPRRSPRVPVDSLPSAETLKRQILIVEDDPKIARALAVRLEAAGYQPRVAHDGVSGIKSAVTQRPDLVLLDISLPAGNGFVVAESIQAHIPEPIPMIFLTASKRPEFRERARELGATDFFEKPFEAELLLRAIHKAVDARQTQAVAH
jgi:DNA-binding response OmpR family regulator